MKLRLKGAAILTFFTLFFHFRLQPLVLVRPVNQNPGDTCNTKRNVLMEKCLQRFPQQSLVATVG